MIDYRVISIGTLAANPLWDERVEVRTGHATTTLIEAGGARIVVNPSLPIPALAARFSERTKVKPHEVTHVFMTNLQPDHRRAVDLFENAVRLVHEPERDAACELLKARHEEASEAGDVEVADIFQQDLEVVKAMEVAPDRIVNGVDLFPLPGVTPGNCGLLISLPGMTVLVCGDAVATVEHLRQGKVIPMCVDVEAAQESFTEAIEIADVFVLGRDDVVINTLRTGMGSGLSL